LYKLYKYPVIIYNHLKQSTNEREVVGDIAIYGKEGIATYSNESLPYFMPGLV
jgi:hypothetical protein